MCIPHSLLQRSYLKTISCTCLEKLCSYLLPNRRFRLISDTLNLVIYGGFWTFCKFNEFDYLHTKLKRKLNWNIMLISMRKLFEIILLQMSAKTNVARIPKNVCIRCLVSINYSQNIYLFITNENNHTF